MFDTSNHGHLPANRMQFYRICPYSVLSKIGMQNVVIMKAHRTGEDFKKDGCTLLKQITFKFLRHSDKQFAIKNQCEKLKDAR